jgi:hypothetical protein
MITKADLHTHGADYFYGCKWFSGKPYGDQTIPKTILDRCFRTADCSLVGIINFDDSRANAIFESIKQLYDSETNHKDGLLSVYQNGKQAHFVIGQEISTDKGHVLIVGTDRCIKNRNLEDALKEAKELDALIIADHVGFPGYSLGEKEIIKHRTYFDAIEIWNGNVPFLHKEQETLASKCGLPGIASSDSHTANGVLTSYTEFNDLDFSNIQDLRQSLRKGLQGVNSYHKGKAVLEGIRHMAVSVIEENILERIGIVKSPCESAPD